MSAPRPPALARRLLRALLPRRDRDALLDDLSELYALRLRRDGALRARAWFWRQLATAPFRFLRAGRAGRHEPTFRPGPLPADHHARGSRMESIWQDIRFAFRTLARSPLYVSIVVLTLAVGIGINATIFTVVNAVLLRPLPVHDPDSLVDLYSVDPNVEIPVTNSYPDLRDLQESIDTLDGIAGYAMMAANVRTGDTSELVYGEMVTGGYFALLGIGPRLGRPITPADDRIPGGHPVVVLGHGYWRERFDADPGIVGETLLMNGTTYTIIGVAQPSFSGMMPGLETQLWVPGMMGSEIDPLGVQSVDDNGGGTRPEQRGNRWLSLKGRMVEGATVAQVQAELDAAWTMLAERYPDTNDDWYGRAVASSSVRVHPAADGYLSPVAYLLLAMVGLVLVSACTNIAAMTLSRATGRSREVAVRLALGAGKGRLVRQLLTESLVLAGAGGLAGLALALWLRGLLLQVRPPLPVPLNWSLPIDLRVVGFTFLIALFAGIAFGIAPALRGSRTELTSALKEGSRGTESSARLGLRGALVVVQVAVCMVLLVGAALLIRSVGSAAEIDLGFDPENVLVFTVDMGLHDYEPEESRAFFDEAERRIRALPGVEGYGLASYLPLTVTVNTTGVYIEGQQVSSDDPSFQTDTIRVNGSYFETMGIPLLAGRTFDQRDNPDSGAPVAMVSEAFARRHFPEGAVGEHFRVGSFEANPIEIVGVVADSKVRTVGEDPRPFIYYAQERVRSVQSASLAIRATDEAVGDVIRRELLALEPELMFLEDTRMTDILSASLFPVRAGATMLVGTGLIALLLVSVGLYGVIAYSVTQRSRELGIRLALGATGRQVRQLVLGRGLVLVAIGAALGTLGAAAMGRGLSSFLYGVGALDPMAFGAAFAVLVVVAGLANWLPARRAARLDPIDTLRAE